MQKQARVVIVGGGVSGLSALYHLTQEGWTDVVLLERDELTSGTTRHSAAQCPQLAFNQLLLLLRQYTIELYQSLAEDVPALVDRPDRVPMKRCPSDSFYMRQEKQGLLVGIYEYGGARNDSKCRAGRNLRIQSL
jgi:glycine/D-amino acid oxidase-like deaminating enzyme